MITNQDNSRGKSNCLSFGIDTQGLLEPFLLEGDIRRRAVLICPGGGYIANTRREGYPVALRFNAYGYHAFILHYSVAPYRHPRPIQDCSRAVRIIRENADAWNIDPGQVIVCGFSAGAHLAASLGVHWDKPYLNTPEDKPAMNRPNALILCYPVISMMEFGDAGSTTSLLGDPPDPAMLTVMSLETQVSAKTPPVFLWHTVTDELVPVENSMMFASALQKNKVPFELHIFAEGPHGLALADRESIADGMLPEPHIAHWFDLSREWLDATL